MGRRNQVGRTGQVTEQVAGQTALSDQYDAWREVPAMGAKAIVSATAEHEPYEIPEEIEAEERALVVAEQPQHHLITGMASLARMSEDEFQEAMLVIERGQKRMREFQQRAMV